MKTRIKKILCYYKVNVAALGKATKAHASLFSIGICKHCSWADCGRAALLISSSAITGSISPVSTFAASSADNLPSCASL